MIPRMMKMVQSMAAGLPPNLPHGYPLRVTDPYSGCRDASGSLRYTDLSLVGGPDVLGTLPP